MPALEELGDPGHGPANSNKESSGPGTPGEGMLEAGYKKQINRFSSRAPHEQSLLKPPGEQNVQTLTFLEGLATASNVAKWIF